MDPMAKLGAALSFSFPTAGAVIVARAEVTSKALVEFAQGHPRMLAALTRISKVGPATEVVHTIAMCMIAAQMDIGKLDPAHPMGQLTGVSSIHFEMRENMRKAQEQSQPDPGGFGDFNITPPPGWDEPVTVADPRHPMFSFTAGPGAGLLNG